MIELNCQHHRCNFRQRFHVERIGDIIALWYIDRPRTFHGDYSNYACMGKIFFEEADVERILNLSGFEKADQNVFKRMVENDKNPNMLIDKITIKGTTVNVSCTKLWRWENRPNSHVETQKIEKRARRVLKEIMKVTP